MRELLEIKNRLNKREEDLSRIKENINNPDTYTGIYNDLKEEMKVTKQEIHIIEWVLNEKLQTS